jgi:hypothetical protein
VKGELDYVLPAVPDATYRQLDYWARRGYLRLTQHKPGPGNAREWPDEEIRVAGVMARLAAAGLPPALAERVARGDSEVAPGVHVLVDPKVERS